MPDSSFWKTRYQEANTPWNLAEPAPPLVGFLQTLPLVNNTPVVIYGDVLVPGCGHGHDAALFARHSLGESGVSSVLGIDVTDNAINLATAAYGDLENLTFQQADALSLPEKWEKQFDGVVEHTLFCALEPHQRGQYLDNLYGVLKPDGWLVGLYWCDIPTEGGPPFGCPWPDLEKLLTDRGFTVQWSTTPENSAVGRQGQERLVFATKAQP